MSLCTTCAAPLTDGGVRTDTAHECLSCAGEVPAPRYGVAMDAAIALVQAGLRVYATAEAALPSVHISNREPASIELAVAIAVPGATVAYGLRRDSDGRVSYGGWEASNGRLALHGVCSAELARANGATEPAPHDVISAAVAS